MHIIAFNRHWVIYWRWLGLVSTSVAILIGLAMWQWQRALEKTEFLQHLAQRSKISAQQLKSLSLVEADGLQLVASAYWLPPIVWLLDNQMQLGRPGYDVIVPTQVMGTQDILLVNLGWVAAPLSRAQLPELNIPAQIRIQGIVRTRLGGLRLGQNSEDNGGWPVRIQQLDIAELSAQIKSTYPVYPGIVYLLQNSPYISHYQPIVVSPDRHRAYALQWALLALAVIAVALAASLKPEKKESFNVGQ